MRGPLISTIGPPSAIKPRLSSKLRERRKPALNVFSFSLSFPEREHFRAKVKSARAACSRATSSVHYFINRAFLIDLRRSLPLRPHRYHYLRRRRGCLVQVQRERATDMADGRVGNSVARMRRRRTTRIG